MLSKKNLSNKDLAFIIDKDIEYFANYKYALYAYIMDNYSTVKKSNKIPAEKIIMLFKEITAIDSHMIDLNNEKNYLLNNPD